MGFHSHATNTKKKRMLATGNERLAERKRELKDYMEWKSERKDHHHLISIFGGEIYLPVHVFESVFAFMGYTRHTLNTFMVSRELYRALLESFARSNYRGNWPLSITKTNWDLIPTLILHTTTHMRHSGYDKIGDIGAGQLSKTFPLCHALTSLVLVDSGISEVGLEKIAAGLPRCRSLTALCLAHTPLSVTGAKKLAAALSLCHSLAKLELMYSKIGDGGAEKIAEALPHCKALATLFLVENKIGVTGATKIAAALPHCRKLDGVTLLGNPIGIVGAEMIINVLQRCLALTSLRLTLGSRDEIERAIAAAHKNNPNLNCKFDVTDCYLNL